MKCLYIVSNGEITPNGRGGGSAIYYDQLMSLRQSGCEVHLWHLATGRSRLSFEENRNSDTKTWNEVEGACSSVQLTTVEETPSLSKRLHDRLVAAIHLTPLVARWDYIKELRRLVNKIQPDFIWAHHVEAATLSAQVGHTPFIYFHHDWLYRILALRDNRPVNRHLQRREESISKSAFSVVTGSVYERRQLIELGCKRVHYIPVTYEPVSVDMSEQSLGRPHLVHLGGMGTTANRMGLSSFFDKAWPRLRADGFSLDVIGDVDRAPKALQIELGKVNCVGFVTDLSSVMRPYDIHIVPWDFPTGQRTRVPLAMNYGQVIVACRLGVAGFEELQSEQNCLLVDSVEEMPSALRRVAEDMQLRLRLGKAAKETFQNSFTRERVVTRYKSVVEELRGA
jgi:glycosyltransferase involved in cell wall biosynthesis